MKLRPEIGDVKYWLHLVVIAFLVLQMTKFFFSPDMAITVRIILESAAMIGVADITAHTLLGLD